MLEIEDAQIAVRLVNLYDTTLKKTEILSFGEDNVIQQGDSKQLSRLFKLFGQFPIIRTWITVAGRVIMSTDNLMFDKWIFSK